MTTKTNAISSIDAYKHKLLPLRAQADVQNRWLLERLDTIIGEIMQRENVDMWLIIAREYNEDPVLLSLLPEPAMSARRRTILLFNLQPDGTVERLALDRYGYQDYYQAGWMPEDEAQFDCLARLIQERNPATIAINHSATFAFGDGLSLTEYNHLLAALGNELGSRLVSAERVCVGWLERRIEAELVVYPGLVELGHALIAEAFSSRVIQPGITTTEDVVWWMRQTMANLGLRAWFQPSIEIQAQGHALGRFAGSELSRSVIMPGDLLHCDVGFTYLGLTTDQQQHAYILKPDEDDAPAGLGAALAEGNRLQDILLETMAVGQSGNQILDSALALARAEGLRPSIYTHPLGYHGHAAGPTIGLWDQQEGVRGAGDYPLFDQTCYSIELNVVKAVPEWENQPVRIALEEDAVLSSGKMRWLDGRQTELFLIGP